MTSELPTGKLKLPASTRTQYKKCPSLFVVMKGKYKWLMLPRATMEEQEDKYQLVGTIMPSQWAFKTAP
jgi:hypothetical protein